MRTIYVGNDGTNDLMLEVFDDGTHQLATRPHPGATWGPPVVLTRQTAEVSS